MIRKFCLFSLLFLLVFSCCACDGDVTRALRHAGFSMGSEFVCDSIYPKKKDDTDYEKIKYLTASHFITDKGKIYEISLSGQFSNKANCRVANTEIEVQAIFDGKVVKASDGKYYSLIEDNTVSAYSEVDSNNSSYSLYNLLLGQDGTLKVITVDSSNGIYYVLKNDGNVYSYTVSKADRNTPMSIVGTSIVYNKNDYLGEIIDFNYAGDSPATFARTKNKAYKMTTINTDECGKYVDIACKYKMKEFESFEKYEDYILAYNGNVIITKYKMVFNASS